MPYLLTRVTNFKKPDNILILSKESYEIMKSIAAIAFVLHKLSFVLDKEEEPNFLQVVQLTLFLESESVRVSNTSIIFDANDKPLCTVRNKNLYLEVVRQAELVNLHVWERLVLSPLLKCEFCDRFVERYSPGQVQWTWLMNWQLLLFDIMQSTNQSIRWVESPLDLRKVRFWKDDLRSPYELRCLVKQWSRLKKSTRCYIVSLSDVKLGTIWIRSCPRSSGCQVHCTFLHYRHHYFQKNE